MYITTSRKPAAATRVLAGNLASLLNGDYENRGKKSIDEVVERARFLGYRRVMMIGETKGNPNRLSFIRIGRSWEWLNPEVMFSMPTSQLKERIRPLGKDVELISSNKEVGPLFEIPEPTTDNITKLSISADRITFFYDRKRLILNIKSLSRISSEGNEEENSTSSGD